LHTSLQDFSRKTASAIADRVVRAGLAAQRLLGETGELVDVALVLPPAAPLDLLTRLRVRGFGLGIDGFGTAHATLQELERLPLTEVKIAADALARGTASARGAEAFGATVQALRDQGLDVVCDGCDSPAEWELALQAGCRRAQGAFVGPPLAPEDLATWLRTWSGVL